MVRGEEFALALCFAVSGMNLVHAPYFGHAVATNTVALYHHQAVVIGGYYMTRHSKKGLTNSKLPTFKERMWLLAVHSAGKHLRKQLLKKTLFCLLNLVHFIFAPVVH